MSKTLYLIKESGLSREELAAVLVLEGVLAKNEPRVFLDTDIYTSYLQNVDLIESDFFSLFVKFRDEYNSSFVTFSLGKADDPCLNMAASVASATGIPALPLSLREKALSLGFSEYMNLDDIKGTPISRQRYIFEKYKENFSNDGLVHLVSAGNDHPIRMYDHPVSKNLFCFYTGEGKEDKEFRFEVLRWAKPNIAIYGWTTNELDFVNDISQYGDYIIPADWSVNHSYLTVTKPLCAKQKRSFEKPSQTVPEENVHYLCIEVSDGDNAQWLERDFSTTSTFGQRLTSSKKNDYIVNWTFSPSLCLFNPYAVNYLYSRAGKDLFVSGVSGAGYMNCTKFPNEYLKTFTKETAHLMACSDLKVVTLLDNKTRFDAKDKDFVRTKIDFYAQHGEIEGGLWEMDPDRYEDGKGEIFWSSNGKPFASVRLSLWHPSNRGGMVTEEWLKSYADKINSFPCDSTSPEGYTLLNIHPWTVNIPDVDVLVSMLDEHVKIVDAETFISLIKNNVIH